MAKEYSAPYFETCCDEDEEVLGPRHAIQSIKNEPRSLVEHRATKFISEDELNRGLDIFLPRCGPEPDKIGLKDAVFPRISELLMLYGKGEWSLRPRTFTILRIMGCPEALDEFIKLGRTDSFLPYTDSNLPGIIEGSDRRKLFFKLQNLLLCRQRDISAVEEGGEHVHLIAPGDTYFKHRAKLGEGHYGNIVDEVYGRLSLCSYARKLIPRGGSQKEDSKMCRQFESEIRALKKLSHRHIVKFVGSYTDEQYLGLLMTPIAEMNLGEFLWSTNISPIGRRSLQTYFGCLATALAYLHSRDIRHNDIKPKNILIKDSVVYLTDFGESKSWGTEERSTGHGEDEGFTWQYSAPEAHNTGGARNRASDIWSLGCVFLEMATVLLERSLEDLGTFLGRNGTLSRNFWGNHTGTKLWIAELRDTAPQRHSKMLDWTAKMLQCDAQERPTAAQLRGDIIDFKGDGAHICHDCTLPSALPPPRSSRIQKQSEPGWDLEKESTARSAGFNVGPKATTVTASALGFQERPSPSTKPHASTKAVATTETTDVMSKPIPHSQDKPNSQKANLEGSSPAKGLGKINQAKENIAQEDATEKNHSEAKVGPKDLSDGGIAERRLADNSIQAPGLDGYSLPERGSPTSNNRTVVAAPQTGKSDILPWPAAATPEAAPPVTKLDSDGLPGDTPTQVKQQPGSEQAVSGRAATEGGAKPKTAEPVNADGHSFVQPEPLTPPAFHRKPPRPKASLAPSYIYAERNLFPGSKLEYQDESFEMNLFVYGRLMFPSVLRAIAAQSIKGVYCRQLKRRLHPSSGDWAKTDVSIARASQAMTPARLNGYDRWRPRGLNCAVVQDSRKTAKIVRKRRREGYDELGSRPPGHVDGFLVVGVRSEALRYLDLLFGTDSRTMRTMRPQDDPDRDEETEDSKPDSAETLLQRRRVDVQVADDEGYVYTVYAETYVWSYGIDDLTHLWKEDRFVRSGPMQTLLGDYPTWTSEEQAIATEMNTSFAQVGDVLCAAIVAGDLDRLEALLVKDRYDANAGCSVYGHPLQAAVCAARDDMASLLLAHGAKIDATGGQYGTALIAAACGSRKATMMVLLHHGANVFARDGARVNALYQAVANSDYAVAEMLLEHGAWLGEDWHEISDLAAEMADREVQALLDRYDVRKIHRQHKLIGHGEEKDGGGGAANQQPSDLLLSQFDSWHNVSYSKVLVAVARKAAGIQKISGSWKGRRGVAVTVAALDAGAPLKLIAALRGVVNPLRAIVDVLRRGDEREQAKYRGTAAHDEVAQVEPRRAVSYYEYGGAREAVDAGRGKVAMEEPQPEVGGEKRGREKPQEEHGITAAIPPPPYSYDDPGRGKRRVRFAS